MSCHLRSGCLMSDSILKSCSQDDWCKDLTLCDLCVISSVVVTSRAEEPEEVEPVAMATREEEPTFDEDSSVAPVSLGPQCMMGNGFCFLHARAA